METEQYSRRTLRPVPLALVLSAVALVCLAGCGKKSSSGPGTAVKRNSAVAVTVAEVAVVPLDQTLPVLGTLLPRDEATVSAQVEGQIEKTFVDFGNTVTAGQELARIDTESYEALAKQSAAAMAKAQANSVNAEQNLKRVKELQASKISSASDFDLATAQAEQARAEIKAAEASESIARLNLARSHARAPFDGVVSERISNAGDYVKTGTPLFRLVNDTELKYMVQAPERYSGMVENGQRVELTVDALPQQVFEGTVYLINPAVSPATRSFSLAARVLNGDRKLKAYSFARGELILRKAVPTTVVPLEAVLNFAGITKVFVLENNVAHAREVKVGRILKGTQEIFEGLKAGERVITSGQTKLYEGAQVRIPQVNAEAGVP